MPALVAAQLQELSKAVSAGRIASYVSVGSCVVVFYDHLLLLQQEIRLIWSSKTSIWKVLFLLNRYGVLPCFVWLAYQLSGLSSRSYSHFQCQLFFSVLSVIGTISIAISNAFVFHRVYTIWDRRPHILKSLIALYSLIYVVTIVLCTIAIKNFLVPRVSLKAEMCAIDERIPFLAAAYTLPSVLDIILLVLTCWNALDRPTATEYSSLTRELIRDGVVYFAISLALRTFNIVVFSKIGIVYTNLAWPALWAIITAVVNRMILFGMKESQQVQLLGYDPKGRTPAQLGLPFVPIPHQSRLTTPSSEEWEEKTTVHTM